MSSQFNKSTPTRNNPYRRTRLAPGANPSASSNRATMGNGFANLNIPSTVSRSGLVNYGGQQQQDIMQAPLSDTFGLQGSMHGSATAQGDNQSDFMPSFDQQYEGVNGEEAVSQAQLFDQLRALSDQITDQLAHLMSQQEQHMKLLRHILQLLNGHISRSNESQDKLSRLIHST